MIVLTNPTRRPSPAPPAPSGARPDRPDGRPRLPHKASLDLLASERSAGQMIEVNGRAHRVQSLETFRSSAPSTIAFFSCGPRSRASTAAPAAAEGALVIEQHPTPSRDEPRTRPSSRSAGPMHDGVLRTGAPASRDRPRPTPKLLDHLPLVAAAPAHRRPARGRARRGLEPKSAASRRRRRTASTELEAPPARQRVSIHR